MLVDTSLYPRIYAWDNLLLAYRKASKGKRGFAPAARFEYHLEDNLITLQAELQDKTYRPGAYHSFTIHEPKRRLISAAPFRDRVVHHALCNLIEPIFERSFIYGSLPSPSFGSRAGGEGRGRAHRPGSPPAPLQRGWGERRPLNLGSEQGGNSWIPLRRLSQP
jgi:hypothetical protein